jgi:serine/threonine protein kinase
MATAKEKNMFLEELSGSDKIASVTNPSMDIWALGLVFYRLWYGKDFITSLGYEETGKEKETICQGLLNVLPNRDKVFADKTDDVGQLIQSMLSMDPKKRPAAKDLLKA